MLANKWLVLCSSAEIPSFRVAISLFVVLTAEWISWFVCCWSLMLSSLVANGVIEPVRRVTVPLTVESTMSFFIACIFSSHSFTLSLNSSCCFSNASNFAAKVARSAANARSTSADTSDWIDSRRDLSLVRLVRLMDSPPAVPYPPFPPMLVLRKSVALLLSVLSSDSSEPMFSETLLRCRRLKDTFIGGPLFQELLRRGEIVDAMVLGSKELSVVLSVSFCIPNFFEYFPERFELLVVILDVLVFGTRVGP